jgi:FkbM family methyltransferase
MTISVQMKRYIGRFIPPILRRAIKPYYYYRLAAGFTPAQWPWYAVVKKWIKPGDRVIDVGANIGCITKMLAQLVGEEGRVIAIEPVPQTFGLLAHNIHKLNLHQVQCIQAAATNSDDCPVKMQIPVYKEGVENIYEARVVNKEKNTGHCIDAPTVTLDAFGSSIKDVPVKFIKIDVEGHEYAVIQGACNLLKKHRPILLVEIDHILTQKGEADRPNVFQILADMNYLSFYMEANGTLERYDTHSKAVDYLFIPSELYSA